MIFHNWTAVIELGGGIFTDRFLSTIAIFWWNSHPLNRSPPLSEKNILLQSSDCSLECMCAPADRPWHKMSAFYVTLMFFQFLDMVIEWGDRSFTDRFPLRVATFWWKSQLLTRSPKKIMPKTCKFVPPKKRSKTGSIFGNFWSKIFKSHSVHATWRNFRKKCRKKNLPKKSPKMSEIHQKRFFRGF